MCAQPREASAVGELDPPQAADDGRVGIGEGALAVQELISFPSYEKDKGDLREPDFRNCLIWLPNLTLDELGSSEAQFYTSDKKGEYHIYIRGITSDGQVVSGQSTIYVE